MRAAATVFVKELRDAVRDRRSWLVALSISLLSGPVVFLLVSNFVSGVQERIAQREVLIDAPEHAPTLVNFLQRAGATVRAAPADYEAQLLFIVPWVALIVSVFGALSVAIDVTAGERERGSLEPLMMNPVPAGALVLGKWGVVMLYTVAIVVLTMAGFLASMRLVTNESLAALMQLQWREVAVFTAVLLPFGALMAALNMLAATFGRSYKEAQTYVSYIAMSAQFGALAPVFLAERDAAWQLFVPSVAQLSVLMKALRGDAVAPQDLLIPAAVCAVAGAACLLLMARLLRRESVVFARS